MPLSRRLGVVTKAACTSETPQPTGTPVRQPNPLVASQPPDFLPDGQHVAALVKR
jgi:hypothetical protein